jgi:excinuclease ABC subunit B
MGGATGAAAAASPHPRPSSARGEGEEARGFGEAPQSEFAPANYGTSATIPTLDPELAKQLGFTTEEEDDAA